MTLVGSQSAVPWMKNDKCLKLRAGNDLGKQILSVRCTSRSFPAKGRQEIMEGDNRILWGRLFKG